MKLLSLLWFLLAGSAQAATGVLVMAYPERQKDPFIAEMPDNTGIYKEVFTRAAGRLGLELRIVRLPKKRLFQEMRQGRVDFYPGSFAQNRSEVMNWIESGLTTKFICLTRRDVPPIDNLSEAPKLRLIHEIGDSRSVADALHPNITPVELGPRIDMPQAIRLLKGGRGDLFLIDKLSYRDFMQKNHYASGDLPGLRYHENCIGREQPILLGFSRFSKLYGEEANPAFDATHPVAPANLPTIISAGSVAGRLGAVLKSMREHGEIQRIVDQYSPQ